MSPRLPLFLSVSEHTCEELASANACNHPEAGLAVSKQCPMSCSVPECATACKGSANDVAADEMDEADAPTSTASNASQPVDEQALASGEADDDADTD